MPRYEIVAHIRRELDAASAEEAAAEFRRELLAESGAADALLHLAVWREDPAPAVSPLPSPLRQRLEGFFTGLERSASDAEETFRGRVEAILMAPGPGAEEDGGAPTANSEDPRRT